MRATLVADGSSDAVLIPLLSWLLAQLTPEPWELRWADLRGLSLPPRHLEDRIQVAVEYYPCDLLFVHRDAEKEPPDARMAEIIRANRGRYRHVCVVPVHMQEAWLLHDEASLREAAGRPLGSEPLQLPPLKRIESIPDPKQVLHQALRSASGLTGRRSKQFRPSIAAHRLAELITDWTPLRQLDAFQRLEEDTRKTLRGMGLDVR